MGAFHSVILRLQRVVGRAWASVCRNKSNVPEKVKMCWSNEIYCNEIFRERAFLRKVTIYCFMDKTQTSGAAIDHPITDAMKLASRNCLPSSASNSAHCYQPIILFISNPDSTKQSDRGHNIVDVTSSIAAVLNAVAWPLTILVITILFRKRIGSLISRLKKGKFGNSELEFESLIRDAESDVEAVVSQPQKEIDPALLALVDTHPRGAIISAWLQIERLANEVIESRGICTNEPIRRSPTAAIREIEKADILPAPYIALFQDLRVLRNEAAHAQDFEPSPESVIRYLQLSQKLMDGLREAKATPPTR